MEKTTFFRKNGDLSQNRRSFTKTAIFRATAVFSLAMALAAPAHAWFIVDIRYQEGCYDSEGTFTETKSDILRYQDMTRTRVRDIFGGLDLVSTPTMDIFSSGDAMLMVGYPIPVLGIPLWFKVVTGSCN